MSKASMHVEIEENGEGERFRVEIDGAHLESVISLLEMALADLKERNRKKHMPALREQAKAWQKLLDEQRREMSASKGSTPQMKELQ